MKKEGRLLAVGALVFGGLALLTSVVLVGALAGLVALGLGWAHLRRRSGSRGLAWTGVWLGAMGVAASVVFGVIYATVLPVLRERAMSAEMGRGRGAGLPQSWVGQPCPEVELTLLDGSRLRLADLRGKRVVLAFWATWCKPCLKEVPLLERLHREHAGEVVVVGISAEDRTVLKRFAQSHGVGYPLASADPAGLPPPLSGVQGFPTTVYVDSEGRIDGVIEGNEAFEALRARALGTGAGATAQP